jgi:hypothetical protein
MKNLLAALLLLTASAASALSPLPLEGVSAAAAGGVAVPAPSAPLALPYRRDAQPEARYFNRYVLQAVEYLNGKYGLLGYNINSILTHDIQYHDQGIIKARRAPLTMCVAAVMEVMLTAYEFYAAETGDYSPYAYLPKSSYERLAVTDIKGHIWVNTAFRAHGTADALINFGMGERRKFEELRPGDFVNLNRTTKTGHAVVFLGYVTSDGKVTERHGAGVIGFKYFSSQGREQAGQGGFDYRYAVFSRHGCPELPYKRDCNVIYSSDQKYLNTGTMLAPAYWTGVIPTPDWAPGEQTALNRGFFNGITTDD